MYQKRRLREQKRKAFIKEKNGKGAGSFENVTMPAAFFERDIVFLDFLKMKLEKWQEKGVLK